jgi:hydrogenase nickel incorporation protein HypB
MGANEEWAAKTRQVLQTKKLKMFNLIGSPGSGKTALLEATAASLANSLSFAVLEGDVETTRDAERLQRVNVPVSQLLTSGACHLEAKLVHHALIDLSLDDLDFVIVENVGNLVCPAEFDIGEAMKIAVLSVTEGEDKPLKYPLLFREAKAVVLTKTDLLPHLPCSLEAYRQSLRQINPEAPVFPLSAYKRTGMDAWIAWLKQSIA